MAPRPDLTTLHGRILKHRTVLDDIRADVAALLVLKQERHEQLTRRYERLERRTDSITNPNTAQNRSLLDDYERLGEQHGWSESELDVWDNEVLEPLTQVLEVLDTLVA